MKRLLLITIILLIAKISFGQLDENGNPIFNNIELETEDFGEYSISSNYYTIENNIDNPESSVFINKKPTKEDYLKFSRDLPSYFFIVHKKTEVFAMIMLVQNNEGSKTELMYNVVNPNTGENIQLPCGTWGEITEKRVEELEKMEIDSTSKIIDLPNGKGYLFNEIMYRIQPYNSLKEEIGELAKYLMKPKEKIEDPIEYIKSETIGGKLDFAKILEKEKQPFFMFENVMYNKKDFSILLWGQAVKRIGIKSEKKAIKLWEKINKKELSEPELKALKKGYGTNLEK